MLIPMELNFYLRHHDYLDYEATIDCCPLEIQKKLYEFDKQAFLIFDKHIIRNYQELYHEED